MEQYLFCNGSKSISDYMALHGTTSQKMVLFIVSNIRIPNLAQYSDVTNRVPKGKKAVPLQA
jgi:hypothetical protein